MTAYELAGRLLEKKLYLIQEGVNSSYLEDASNMLRQQADRIAELENEISTRSWVRKLVTQTKQSEPVAWYTEDKLEINDKPEIVWNSQKPYYAEDWIPLYTTPHHASDVKQTKPLSDEEILEIAGKYWVNRLHYALYFARAIEAKVRGE